MGGLNARTDTDLLLGDAAAFAAFYRRYEDPVLSFFLRRTGRADLAADLTAETFARVLESRGRFDSGLGEPVAWLFGIARKVLLRSLERARVDDETRQRLGMEPVVITDESLRRVLELSDAPASAALVGLPSEQQVAVNGRVLQERSYAELALELECSESVVRQRVSRGLRALRSRLEDLR